MICYYSSLFFKKSGHLVVFSKGLMTKYALSLWKGREIFRCFLISHCHWFHCPMIRQKSPADNRIGKVPNLLCCYGKPRTKMIVVKSCVRIDSLVSQGISGITTHYIKQPHQVVKPNTPKPQTASSTSHAINSRTPQSLCLD